MRDTTTERNNNPVALRLSSGANLVITGPIQDNNVGNVSSTDPAARFVFRGAGANVTLLGTNLYGLGVGTGFSTTIECDSGVGYNSVTVGGADWAVGAGVITALAAYDSFAVPGANRNVLQVGSAGIVGPTINTLKLGTTGSGQALTITSGILTLDRRGILFVGAHDYAITGSTLRGRIEFQEELIVHQFGSGTLTIASRIDNRTDSALVKAGPGTLVLAHAANAYSRVHSWSAACSASPKAAIWAAAASTTG